MTSINEPIASTPFSPWALVKAATTAPAAFFTKVQKVVTGTLLLQQPAIATPALQVAVTQLQQPPMATPPDAPQVTPQGVLVEDLDPATLPDVDPSDNVGLSGVFEKLPPQNNRGFFLNQMPSNRDDQMIVFKWVNTRAYDPEIAYNSELNLEIRNELDGSVPLANALKEIRTWLTKCYCFSEDSQSVQINHVQLLSLLEINLRCIKDKLELLQTSGLIGRATTLVKDRFFSREKISPLLESTKELLTQVQEHKLVRAQCISRLEALIQPAG